MQGVATAEDRACQVPPKGRAGWHGCRGTPACALAGPTGTRRCPPACHTGSAGGPPRRACLQRDVVCHDDLAAHGGGGDVGGGGVELGQQEASLAAVLIAVGEARRGKAALDDAVRLVLRWWGPGGRSIMTAFRGPAWVRHRLAMAGARSQAAQHSSQLCTRSQCIQHARGCWASAKGPGHTCGACSSCLKAACSGWSW